MNGVLIEVDARALGVILGAPATGFDLYVQENKSLLGKAKLLELAQHLSQQLGLKSPQAVKKGHIQPLHQLYSGSSSRTLYRVLKGEIRRMPWTSVLLT